MNQSPEPSMSLHDVQRDLWFAGRVLYLRRWEDSFAQHAFGHCAYCQGSFSTTDGNLHEGYTSEDSFHWVCPACFAKHRSRLGWKAAQQPFPDRRGEIRGSTAERELLFWSMMKHCPALLLGEPSFRAMRQFVGGICFAGMWAETEPHLPYFAGFPAWYLDREYNTDQNGYASWHGLLTYHAGTDDRTAFHNFMKYFEDYLQLVHGVTIPEQCPHAST